MSNYTSNYRLKLPDNSEYFNIEDFNGNARTIDKALGNCITKEAFADCVKSVVDCLYPHNYEPKIITLTFDKDFYEEIEGSGMYFYDIPKDDFDPYTDGFFAWVNDSKLLHKDSYVFGVRRYGYISFSFSKYTHHDIIDNGDTVTLLIYKNKKISDLAAKVEELENRSVPSTFINLLDGSQNTSIRRMQLEIPGNEYSVMCYGYTAKITFTDKFTKATVYANHSQYKLYSSIWAYRNITPPMTISSTKGLIPIQVNMGGSTYYSDTLDISIGSENFTDKSQVSLDDLKEFYIVLER